MEAMRLQQSPANGHHRVIREVKTKVIAVRRRRVVVVIFAVLENVLLDTLIFFPTDLAGMFPINADDLPCQTLKRILRNPEATGQRSKEMWANVNSKVNSMIFVIATRFFGRNCL
jgi:hypothetical protein